ncbi:Uncharacterised protein [Sphingobacterium multivorum]|uniref:hypothetical protein n=1 Tax=Sphingobacterium multivorum TaxID=28454 RepID=UPI000E070868|nr:hypothetical protein [Sphingobacterium multivorum]QQT43316.1 hypothetical protein I6J00_16350 [Sphingobacterium multivorum]SUI98723.1 Uncharacterised protein [Sphingobacterium multivorum]
MENKIKVGQTFEVVEVLTDGGYFDSFKIGGFTIGETFGFGISCLCNTENFTKTYRYMSTIDEEIKPIGKLTITKVK